MDLWAVFVGAVRKVPKMGSKALLGILLSIGLLLVGVQATAEELHVNHVAAFSRSLHKELVSHRVGRCI